MEKLHKGPIEGRSMRPWCAQKLGCLCVNMRFCALMTRGALLGNTLTDDNIKNIYSMYGMIYLNLAFCVTLLTNLLQRSIKTKSVNCFNLFNCTVQSSGCIWEQEIYNQFKYNTPRTFFHTFDTDVSTQEHVH